MAEPRDRPSGARGFWTALALSFRADPPAFVGVMAMETVIAVLGVFGTYAVKALTDGALAGNVGGRAAARSPDPRHHP